MNHIEKGMALVAACLLIAGAPINAEAKSKDADAKSGGAGQVLDNFSKMDWSATKDKGSEIKLSQAAGPGGSALKISYDLKGGKWVAVTKSFVIENFKGKALVLSIKAKGANNNIEIKLVDEDDTNYGVKRALLNKSGDWATWTLSEADFSYWWGGDPTLGRVKDIYFAISGGDGGAGEVLIADMRLGEASKEGNIGKGGVIFDGQSEEGWMLAKGDGASISLESTAGLKGGKAMGIKYYLPAEQWVSLRRAINADLSQGNPSIVIRMKGEGEPNNMEIKLVDRDDSAFGKTFSGMAGSNQWQEVKIPISDFTYLWGGDNRLDASLIRYLDIAISGPGGAGRVIVNDIRVSR